MTAKDVRLLGAAEPTIKPESTASFTDTEPAVAATIDRPARMARRPEGLYKDADGYYCQRGPKLDLETFLRYTVRVGRNNAPALLVDLVYIDKSLDVARVPGAVASAWSDAEHPERAVEAVLWIELFGMSGYTHDGHPADRPSEPVRLFRGSTPDSRFGMSWTTDVEIARRFANGIRGRAPGHVYVATVQPKYLLAYLGAEHRGESEFVVHPDGLSDDNVSRYEVTMLAPDKGVAPQGSNPGDTFRNDPHHQDQVNANSRAGGRQDNPLADILIADAVARLAAVLDAADD